MVDPRGKLFLLWLLECAVLRLARFVHRGGLVRVPLDPTVANQSRATHGFVRFSVCEPRRVGFV